MIKREYLNNFINEFKLNERELQNLNFILNTKKYKNETYFKEKELIEQILLVQLQNIVFISMLWKCEFKRIIKNDYYSIIVLYEKSKCEVFLTLKNQDENEYLEKYILEKLKVHQKNILNNDKLKDKKIYSKTFSFNFL